MTQHDPSLAISELRANVSVPFERARAMPKTVYTSPDFAQAEQEHIFARDWLCAGRADALPNPGDYLTMTIAGEPVIILRDREGVLRGMSNVCRHRMSTLLEGRGTVRSIVCPYHAWTYNLDGSLRGAPAMARNEGFCKDEVKLPPVQVEDWLGWIMVTLAPDAPPVAKQLAGVEKLVGHLPMAGYREVFREEFRWDTNWKVLAENFMESYHLPVCHAGTIGGASDLNQMECPEGEAAFNYHWIVKNDLVPLALAHPSNTVLQGDDRRITWLLAIYPALLITLTPGYFWYLSLTPDGPGSVQVLFGGGMSAEWMADPEAERHLASVKALLDDVNVEDKGCVERVWKGLCAGMSAPGSLSHLERPNYDFARYIAGRMPGVDRASGRSPYGDMTKHALIVAHGQPSDPLTAARALDRLAEAVAAEMPEWTVRAATLAEPMAVARAVDGQDGGVIFPMFMTGGWFTKVQIPARLAEVGAVGWGVLEPFGCDPQVHDLCVTLVREAGAEEVILAAHGSFKSAVPSDIARHVAGRIGAETEARVTVGFIDQAPRLATLTGMAGVCLPFFAAEGGHVSEDIPAALAEAGFQGRILPPVGMDARVPGIIAAAIARGVPVCSGACRWARDQNP